MDCDHNRRPFPLLLSKYCYNRSNGFYIQYSSLKDHNSSSRSFGSSYCIAIIVTSQRWLGRLPTEPIHPNKLRTRICSPVGCSCVVVYTWCVGAFQLGVNTSMSLLPPLFLTVFMTTLVCVEGAGKLLFL